MGMLELQENFLHWTAWKAQEKEVFDRRDFFILATGPDDES